MSAFAHIAGTGSGSCDQSRPEQGLATLMAANIIV